MRRGAPARRPALAPAGVLAARGSTAAHPAVRAWSKILDLHKRGLARVRERLDGELTLARFDLLASLQRKDGQTLASLSRDLLVTPGNLTGLVDRAARDGLVERVADPSDRRAWRVHLTPKGQRAFRDAERRLAQRVGRMFEALTAAELATLTRLLDRLRGDLVATERKAEPIAGGRLRAKPAARAREGWAGVEPGAGYAGAAEPAASLLRAPKRAASPKRRRPRGKT